VVNVASDGKTFLLLPASDRGQRPLQIAGYLLPGIKTVVGVTPGGWDWGLVS